MHLLPPDFDPSIFVGKSIEQILFSVNTVSLNFEENVSITMLATYDYKLKSSQLIRETVAPAQTAITSLLGQEIQTASADNESNLNLDFENGSRLTILNDSEPFESYTLRLGANEIVV